MRRVTGWYPIALASILAFLPSDLKAADWPRFRGPDGNGIRVFTTRRILDALLDGSLALQTARNKNLITFRGGADSHGSWFHVLRDAFARQSTAASEGHGDRVKQ